MNIEEAQQKMTRRLKANPADLEEFRRLRESDPKGEGPDVRAFLARVLDDDPPPPCEPAMTLTIVRDATPPMTLTIVRPAPGAQMEGFPRPGSFSELPRPDSPFSPRSDPAGDRPGPRETLPRPDDAARNGQGAPPAPSLASSAPRQPTSAPEPPPAVPLPRGIVALGKDGKLSYFLTPKFEIVALTPTEFTHHHLMHHFGEAALMELAPIYETIYGRDACGRSTQQVIARNVVGFDDRKAADMLHRAIDAAGLFTDEQQRRCGGWRQGDKFIYHSGDVVYIDGVPHSPGWLV